MKFATRVGVLAALLPALVLFALGCGKQDETPKKDGDKAATDKQAKKDSDKAKEEAKHEGWWCDEHGIPEKECIMCDAKKRAEAKKKGDWCEHKRAKSQCFACDPKLKEFYAAQHRAKYPGKEPPDPVDNK